MKGKKLVATLVLIVGSLFASSAFADDDVAPCTALKAGLCEVCGAEVCAKILEAEADDAECLEIIDELAKAEDAIAGLSEEEQVTFYVELCGELASDDDADEGDDE